MLPVTPGRAVGLPAMAMLLLLVVLPAVTTPQSAAAAGGCARAVGPLRSAPGNGRTAALTFDDGPSKHTSQVLRILRRHDVRATFFVTGRRAAARPKLLRKVASEGHLIAGHTYDHLYPHQVAGGWTHRYLAGQLQRTDRVLTSISGRPICFFRPPGGYQTAGMYAALRDRGTAAVMWSIDSEDWKQPGRTTTAATRRIVARAVEGSRQPHPLILFHDGKASHEPESQVSSNRSNTVAALPAVIAHYRSRGYRFVDLRAVSGLPPETTALRMSSQRLRVPAGTPVTLTGAVTATTGPVGNRSVTWFARRSGATSWQPRGTLTTSATGHVRVAVRPTDDTEYRLALPASTRYRASRGSVAVSTYTIPTTVEATGPTVVTAGETVTVHLVVSSNGSARPGVTVTVHRGSGSEDRLMKVTTDSRGRASFTDQPTVSARYTAQVNRALPFDAGSAALEVTVTPLPDTSPPTALRQRTRG